MTTAMAATPLSGDKLYQERARAALPLLVRQAEAATPIFYSSLARELGMPNPRNLNYVLGCIGQTLQHLSQQESERIPPIQCLVVNKSTGFPGEGIGWFDITMKDFSALSLKRRREEVQAQLQRVYSYPRWRDLLSELDLDPVEGSFAGTVGAASAFRGGGEGAEHKKLKEFVAANPLVVGLPATTPTGNTEVALPSGDFLDVSFQGKSLWVAVEVKSAISSPADITRGIFQCIKYRAVLDAVLLAERRPQNSRAVLVLGGGMPSDLLPLANLLGVEFVDRISPGSQVGTRGG